MGTWTVQNYPAAYVPINQSLTWRMFSPISGFGKMAEVTLRPGAP
jgi:hypothetical protein